jgi:hypothetical protein
MWGRMAFAALVFGLVGEANAKCPRLHLVVSGRVAGPMTGDRQVKVGVLPDPNEPEMPVEVRDREFQANIYFDTFSSYSSLLGHNCSRKPRRVKIALMERGRELATVELRFPRDFVLRGQVYVTRSEVVLAAKGNSSTSAGRQRGSRLPGPRRVERQRVLGHRSCSAGHCEAAENKATGRLGCACHLCANGAYSKRPRLTGAEPYFV